MAGPRRPACMRWWPARPPTWWRRSTSPASTICLYHESLFNPYWGEQMAFGPGNTLRIAMVFQGLDQQQAEDVWRPFRTWVAASPQEFAVENAMQIVSVPARHLWDAAYLRQHY